MKIFADRNILAVEDRFSRHGELHLFDGRGVGRTDLLEADALLVRSITTVDEALLKETKIAFVGTATSGIDHIDTAYLASRRTGFADARGSNANAVVDYCFAAMACAVMHRGINLQESCVGIVGAGAVGGLFADKLEALGVEAVCCDPFLESRETGREYRSLNEALACDVVSLHVPLSKAGPHPTYEMIGRKQLQMLPSSAVLINACRGSVVDEAALKAVLAERPDIFTAFDVWADEPAVDADLVRVVDIATPHIAGYSQEAKRNATELLAIAFEDYFDLEMPKQGGDDDSLDLLRVEMESDLLPEWQTLLQAFPLEELSAQFKTEVAAGTGAKAFDSFRQKLLQRREFNTKSLEAIHYTIPQQEFLAQLGFRLA